MNEKILVVDDEKEIADLLEVYLKNDNYTVYKYYSGIEALTANLSGGEQQRVAIARALTVSPEAILCDEPTGALDKKTGQQIMELLLQIVRENNIMLLLVTHDSDIANTCDTIFEMDEGRLRCAKNDF